MRPSHCAVSWKAAILAALLLSAASLSVFALVPQLEAPASPPPLAPVRIAVVDDNRDRLAGLAAHEVPFATVGVAEEPDLVWDPQTRNVTSGSAVIAYGIGLADLADIIDRTAVVREPVASASGTISRSDRSPRPERACGLIRPGRPAAA